MRRIINEDARRALAAPKVLLARLLALEPTKLLALTIIFAVIVGAWMLRYETVGPNGLWYRDRLTGTVCSYVGRRCFETVGLFEVTP